MLLLFVYFHWVKIGTIPSTICLLTALADFEVINGGSNHGVTCAPYCISSVALNVVPAAICVYPQDNGLCGLIAATNIHNISSYSQWSCTTAGVAATLPCLSPVWPGLTCSSGNIISISLHTIGLSGIPLSFHWFVE